MLINLKGICTTLLVRVRVTIVRDNFIGLLNVSIKIFMQYGKDGKAYKNNRRGVTSLQTFLLLGSQCYNYSMTMEITLLRLAKAAATGGGI